MRFSFKKLNSVRIIYFSGTGGTARAASSFEKAFKHQNVTVKLLELKEGNSDYHVDEDMLVMLYPVHACNAPEIVYKWIDNVSKSNQIPAVVISVSGGGEISPNTACRVSTINRLENKGYSVVYEKMLIMPSNWMVPTVDELSIRLLKILPVKVESIVEDLLAGVVNRTTPHVWDRLFSKLGELEKFGGRYFGRKIKVTDSCNSCGWCIKNCPSNNIIFKNDKPLFNNKCLLCLKCIYGCPSGALKPGFFNFIVVKEGYNLDDIENRMIGVTARPVEELAKGYLWKGVREYLMDDYDNNK